MKILVTAALIPFKEKEREQEYRTAMASLVQLADYYSSEADPCEVLVIESTGNQIPSLFEEFVPAENIVYTKTNNPNFRNKGVNEFISVREGLKTFFGRGKIKEKEFLVKITGRYVFTSRRFLNIVSDSDVWPVAYDLICSLNPDGQMFTGLLGIRAQNLLDICEVINYDFIETHMINVERIFADLSAAEKVYYLPELGIKGQCAQGVPFTR